MNKFYPLDKGFGWYKMPDPLDRDKDYLIKNLVRKLVEKDKELTNKHWNNNGWWGDQGSTPQCVGYSWAHWLEDGPVTHKGEAPVVSPEQIYKEAQKIDEWAGEGYEGTSIRAGAKYLQSLGFIEEYRWGWDLKSVIDAVLYIGPVVVGSYWYTDMMYPDGKGLIKVGGIIEGGHAYKVDGVNKKTKLFRIKNSWGTEWGHKGSATISFDDLQILIQQDGGEVCLAVEAKPEIPSK